jgi:hypothetical protein
VTVQFRGGEVSHAYIGRDLLDRFAASVADHGTVDRPPVLEGRSMTMVLTSTMKPGMSPRRSDGEARPQTNQEAVTVDAVPPVAAAGTDHQAASTTGG